MVYIMVRLLLIRNRLDKQTLCLVDGGHRAVIFNKFTGVRPKVYGEGTHLRIPFFDVPIIYDVRAKPRSVQSLTGSRGMKKPLVLFSIL